jgi:glutamate formiminotransferase/formiminotetrahydrofolate cyclodeaminase
MGAAGATAMGAVEPHVLFVLTLDRESSQAAQAVARALDGRAGGLAHVRARVVEGPGASRIEARVEHVADTPLHRVLALADNEAGRFGAAVSRTSLQGLLPSSTLHDVAVWQLRLEGLEQEQTLEHVLLVAGDAGETQEVLPRSFVDAVASDSPTPGGGSVAALVGALSAALSSMVASLTLGREQYAAVEDDVRELQGKARQVLASLLELASADSAAFEEVMTAYRMPRSTGEETEARRDAIDTALHKAIRVPLEIMSSSLDAMRVAHRVAQLGNIKAVSDAGVAGYMGHAAVKSASLNVDVNVPGLRDLEQGDRYRREAGEMLAQASDLAGRIEVTVRERMKG